MSYVAGTGAWPPHLLSSRSTPPEECLFLQPRRILMHGCSATPNLHALALSRDTNPNSCNALTSHAESSDLGCVKAAREMRLVKPRRQQPPTPRSWVFYLGASLRGSWKEANQKLP